MPGTDELTQRPEPEVEEYDLPPSSSANELTPEPEVSEVELSLEPKISEDVLPSPELPKQGPLFETTAYLQFTGAVGIVGAITQNSDALTGYEKEVLEKIAADYKKLLEGTLAYQALNVDRASQTITNDMRIAAEYLRPQAKELLQQFLKEVQLILEESNIKNVDQGMFVSESVGKSVADFFNGIMEAYFPSPKAEPVAVPNVSEEPLPELPENLTAAGSGLDGPPALPAELKDFHFS